MKEYEIIIEAMNPCGGERYAQQEIIEAEIESPEDYVEANKRLPVIETIHRPNGEVVIETGNEAGYRIRYTFSE